MTTKYILILWTLLHAIVQSFITPSVHNYHAKLNTGMRKAYQKIYLTSSEDWNAGANMGVLDVEAKVEEDEVVTDMTSSVAKSVKSNKTKASSAKKEKAKPKSSREMTGYKYSDQHGEYDVPILDKPMWFRVQVKKSSEFKLAQFFQELKSQTRWHGIIEDAYVPETFYPRFKGSLLVPVPKPVTPGVLYIKVKMDPDIADAIEATDDVIRLVKTQNTKLVVPLNEQQGANLEEVRIQTVRDLPPEIKLMKKNEYVKVLSGIHEGRYGILTATKSGLFEVLLRGQVRDEKVLFEPSQLEYYADPPEVKVKEMTAKDAVESLMIKEPNSPILKALRRAGKLQEILYSDEEYDRSQQRRDERFDSSRSRDRDDGYDSRGREGGARIRSIAKSKDIPIAGGPTKSWSPSNKRDTTSSSSSSSNSGPNGKFWDLNDLSFSPAAAAAAAASERSQKSSRDTKRGDDLWNNDSSSSGGNSQDDINLDENTDWLSSILSDGSDSGSSNRNSVPISQDEDYDSMINNLLGELDSSMNTPAVSKPAPKKKLDMNRETDRMDSESVYEDLMKELNLSVEDAEKEWNPSAAENKKKSSKMKSVVNNDDDDESYANYLNSITKKQESSPNTRQNKSISSKKSTTLNDWMSDSGSSSSTGNIELDELSELWSVSNPDEELNQLLGNTDITTSDLLGSFDSDDDDNSTNGRIDRSGSSNIDNRNKKTTSSSNMNSMPESITLINGKKVWTSSSSVNKPPPPMPSPSYKKNRGNSGGNGSEPNMEDYPDFESYIAAVLAFEQQSQSNPITNPKSSTSTKDSRVATTSNKRTNKQSQESKAFDDLNIYDSLDDFKSNNDDDDDNFITNTMKSINDKNSDRDSMREFTQERDENSNEGLNDFLDEFYEETKHILETPSPSPVSSTTSSMSDSDSATTTKNKSKAKTTTTKLKKDAIVTTSPPTTATSTSSITATMDTEIDNKKVTKSNPTKTATKTTITATSTTTAPTTASSSSSITSSSSPSSSSSTTTTTTSTDYDKMTVPVLKGLLKDVNQKVTGTKAELIQRLLSTQQ